MRLILLFMSLFFLVGIAWGQSDDYQLKETYRNEIITISEDDRIKGAFQTIFDLEDYTLNNHILLNEIEAPPFKEENRAKVMLKLIRDIGIDSSWIDKAGNVIGMRKGTNRNKSIALDAHLDTVFPEGTDVTVQVRNDTLFAPGIGDDTRGLAMVLTTLKALNENNIQTVNDILFIASVGEEGPGDLRGVKELFGPDGPGIDSWISIDGGKIGRVNNKGLGSYRYRVLFKGPGGHSWGAFGLVNPHHALGAAVDIFTEKADIFTTYGPRTSYNVGMIGGGTSINSVPFESWMEIDIRSVQPERLDTLEAILYKAVEEAVDKQNKMKRMGADMSAEILKIGDRPSGELSSDNPIIQRAIAATAFFGKRPELTRGSTNSNIPFSLKIPAVTIGRGGTGANAHSLDEWWFNEEGYKAIQLALLLLCAEAGLSN